MMKNLVLLFCAAVFALCAGTFTLGQVGNPEIRELKLVAQIPPELPQRVMGLAYDGENLWATIRQITIVARFDGLNGENNGRL